VPGPDVHIEPWGASDLALLQRLLGDPAMMRHLGGPEPAAKIAQRQQRYLADPRQFRIVVEAAGEAVGWVGYWDHEWREQAVFEVGWSVLPEWQGRGIAGRATLRALAHARAGGQLRYIHAFPSVDNGPSNAICRKLGFELLEAIDFEYPPGSAQVLRCNDWRLDLQAGPGA
jgi:RimJ/RimL family protein N-acetyltransferase